MRTLWCHTALHMENPISALENINLYMTICGHWIPPRGIVYMTLDLAMEASYTIHENNYWHNK